MIAIALIDTSALGKIVLASLVGGVGVVVAFGLLLLGLSKGARAKVAGRPVEQAGYYLISALCGLFCVGAIGFGIYAIVSRPSSPAPKPAAKAAAVADPAKLLAAARTGLRARRFRVSRDSGRAIPAPGGIWR